MTTLLRFGLRIAGLVLLVPFFFLIVNGAAFRQGHTEVAVREPGDRFLGKPRPVQNEARKDVDFALLSQAAYQRTPNSTSDESTERLDADKILQENLHWHRWDNFPGPDLLARIAASHLRVEVWQNDERGAVAVAFGGTVFENRADWRANLRWFFPTRNDEYTQVVKAFGPEFVGEFLRLRQLGKLGDNVELFSTGHSLGGGLAQQFAYSLPTNSSVPRVKWVYAFDPSPVTGFYSVDSETRDSNSKGMSIERIYQRGEILAVVRSLTNFVYTPSAKDPVIRQVRYNLISRSPISGHSMADLACMLYKVSGENRAN